MFKRILVPIDFSKEAELALKTSIGLAHKAKKTTITLLHVLTYGPDYEKEWVPRIFKLEEEKIKSLLHEWQKKIPKTIKSTSLIQRGKVAETIRAICKKKKMDMVVMTTHGRRGVNRLIQPNESELTVRIAPCPVLVLHLNKRSKKIKPTERKTKKGKGTVLF